MEWDHIIKNGTIVTSKDLFKGNVYIKDGKIAAITSEDFGGQATEITDASGLYVLPGLLTYIQEMEVHLRKKIFSTLHRQLQ